MEHSLFFTLCTPVSHHTVDFYRLFSCVLWSDMTRWLFPLIRFFFQFRMQNIAILKSFLCNIHRLSTWITPQCRFHYEIQNSCFFLGKKYWKHSPHNDEGSDYFSNDRTSVYLWFVLNMNTKRLIKYAIKK